MNSEVPVGFYMRRDETACAGNNRFKTVHKKNLVKKRQAIVICKDKQDVVSTSA
jgi:hypothetical protein